LFIANAHETAPGPLTLEFLSLFSWFQDGKTNVVANDAGDRTTPALVAFTDHDQVSDCGM
jgi:hypothetical protein